MKIEIIEKGSNTCVEEKKRGKNNMDEEKRDKGKIKLKLRNATSIFSQYFYHKS